MMAIYNTTSIGLPVAIISSRAFHGLFDIFAYFINLMYFFSLDVFLCAIQKISMTHHISKITGTLCPAVDFPEIKASSEKCCTVDIMTSIALKKLFCTVNYMYNKNPIL